MRCNLALVLIGLGVQSTAYPAEMALQLNSDFCSAITITVSGPIAKGDAKLFSSLVDQLNSHVRRTYGQCNRPPMVLMDSRGGNVEESLAIGRTLRDRRLRTVVPRAGECYSSCIFILAAGVDRSVYGATAIHRPYFYDIEKGKTVEEIRTARASQISRIATYLESMDVSLSLLDAMISVPPEEMRQLTENELQTYRLTGEDPSYEEYRVNSSAKLFNMPTAEYRQRHKAAWRKCDAYGIEDTVCVNAELLGISMSEARARWDRLQNCRKKTTNELNQNECFVKYMTRGEK